ncbi:MAG: hypothetical protein JSV78_09195 [Phycisphaerales bacterium]|nr:MAG: hypothetical protein JSV78_09195 [Phycisphaerales bacterium]
MNQRIAAFLSIFSTLALPAYGGLVIVDTEPGSFIDISDSGTPMGLGDEGVAQALPDFPLSQTMFSGGGGIVWVSNNGALGFLVDGSAGAFYLNGEIPSIGLFGGAHGTPQALAVYWDDLDSDTGEVYYATVGEPGERVFIVQWQDRPHYPGDATLDGDEVTFQVQIFEAVGNIKAQFLYQDVDFLDPSLDEGASATVGYQDGEGSGYVQWSFNEPGAVTADMVLTLLEVSQTCEYVGDNDGDCDIDLDDYSDFASCCLGPDAGASPACECLDMNMNGVVDLADFAVFQRDFTGPDETIPGCQP